MTNNTPSPRRALVLGCGGVAGGAWSIAALHHLEQKLDWDARDADILIGTSAGAVLATLLGRPINFLVLDEPTNHLDIQSREVLMEALKDFEGTLVVVSHDRHFLREVSNRTIMVDGGKIRVFEGGYTEFLESEQGNTQAR